MRSLGCSLMLVTVLSVVASSDGVAGEVCDRVPAASGSGAHDWSGLYFGGNVGYGWGDDTGGQWRSWTDTPGSNYTFYFSRGGNVLPGVRPRGVLGGAQFGYNWQLASCWVLGIVADIQGSDMNASASRTITPVFVTTSIQTNTASVDWFGTVRGRVGYAFQSWLFYGTGGLAYGGVKSTVTLECPGCASKSVWSGSNSATNIGWAVGAGVEVALTQRLTVGAEYLHFDLGGITTTASRVSGSPVYLNTFTAESEFSGDIVRVTANLKLN